MVHGDVRDDGEFGTDHMGGIEAAPHAHLENGDIHGAPRKMQKGERRGEFEVGHPFPIRPAHLPDAPFQVLRGNRDPVDPDALPEIDQVGRRVEPDAVSRRLEDGGQGRRDGALAVRPPHEDAAVTVLGAPQAIQQPPDGTQSRPDAGTFQTVKVLKRIETHGLPGSRAMNLSPLQGASPPGLPCALDPVPWTPLVRRRRKLPQPRRRGQPLCIRKSAKKGRGMSISRGPGLAYWTSFPTSGAKSGS